MASGSKDTDVIIWDLVAEVGLFKLRGHKDQITGLEFLEPSSPDIIGEDGEAMVQEGLNDSQGFLLTTGKDSLIKLWDVASRHCIETHVTQTNGECWSLGVSPDGSGCITAGNDGELEVWFIDTSSLLKHTELEGTAETRYLHNRGVLHRQVKDRALEIKFHPVQDYFAVHGSEKGLELWRIRSEDEVKKSLARKRKRRREKQAASGEKVEVSYISHHKISSADEWRPLMKLL